MKRGLGHRRTLVMYKPRPLPPPPCSLLALNCTPSVNSCFKWSLQARIGWGPGTRQMGYTVGIG